MKARDYITLYNEANIKAINKKYLSGIMTNSKSAPSFSFEARIGV
jgi:hypothetical protein